jgi:hypothetical protein
MNELQHHGVKGMKWGVRRYQKKDGTLTPAGKKRYAEGSIEEAKANLKDARKDYKKAFRKADAHRLRAFHPKKSEREANSKRWEDVINKSIKVDEAKTAYKAARKAEKALKKVEKQEYKDFVKTRSKEILAGESAVGKIWDVLTDAHKYQAQIEYGMKVRES